MKLQYRRVVTISVCALFLAGSYVYAQENVKDGKAVSTAAVGTLQSVTVSADGTRIDISADKPLTYTFYKTSTPPKAVIDLALTDVGSLRSPIEVDRGNIRRIDLAKHDFGGGVLTRIEVLMKGEGEAAVFPVKERNRLQVEFHGGPVAEKAEAKPAPAGREGKAQSEPVKSPADVNGPAAAAENVASEAAGEVAGGTENKAATEPAAAGAKAAETQKTENAAAKETPAPKQAAARAVKTVAAVRAVQDGIEIVVPGGVEKFTSFKMTNPERVVIDLPGILKYNEPRVVALGKFGIGNARIGLTADKARVVLDAADRSIPSYQIVKDEEGLKVSFNPAAPAATPAKAVQETPKEPAKPAAALALVQSIDFKVSEGYSRITVNVDSACSVGKPAKHTQGYLLSIDNCQVPAKLQRMIDTKGFGGPVRSITPYQVRSKGRSVAKILVKARSGGPFNFAQEGAAVHWDFKNPAEMQAGQGPALVSGKAVSQEAGQETGSGEPKSGLLRELSAGEQPQVSVIPGDKKRYTGRKVTLEFSDADIRKIFQLIAEVSNLNFLIADDVTGTISIKLVNVPWDQALDVILESKNLEMKRDGNIVQIKPAGKFKTIEQGELEAKRARERAMELHTAVFDINYASVADVVAQLNTLKTPRDGVSIAQDARTNRVIVTDIVPAIDKMRTLLKTLDTPEKQVMIEARIVEATSTFTRDLGVQWGVHYVDGSAGNLFGISKLDTGFGGIVTAPPTSGTSGPGAAVGMSFGKLASNIQLDLRLSAAATNGQIKIISTPKVVTLNNKAAKISQGQSIPYQTTSAEGTKTEFVEAALTLEVTPHITADGNIGMKIKASNNSPGTGTPPPINKKEATTELQVKNGETTVIGGIYVDSDTESDSGVPFLQDVPLLGWLFKSNTKTKTKTELLIFITPRIVS